MLGVGWTEMLVIGVVALIVIGPKELPALMNRIGKFAGTIRRMGSEFQREINKTTGLDEVKSLRTAITQPLKATTDAIRKEFNATTSSGAVQPSGALKPADPNVESVVSEIHKTAGMTPPETAEASNQAMRDAMKQAMLNQSAINKEAAAKAAAAAPTPVKAAPRKPAATKAPAAPKATPKKAVAKKVDSPAPIEAIAPAKKAVAKAPAVKAAPAKSPAKPTPKAAAAKPTVTAKAAAPAAKRKPAAKKV